MKIYLLSFLILIFSACKKKESEQQQISLRTVLIYMGGDNNLYKETEDKIEALRKGYKKDMGHLLVYQDAIGVTPRLIEIFSDAQGTGKIRTLKSYQEENSASATVFNRVLEDIKKEAPSLSYGLILFSHASGWLPKSTLLKPRTIVQDRDDDLELQDFARAIPDNFFDFMIFEACFMSGIEVLYQLKDKTDYILASSAEILSPGFTPLYPRLLPFLYEPEADLKSFAEIYFEHYDLQKGDYRSATVSVIKTAGLKALADWAEQFPDKSVSPSVLTDIQHFDRYPDYRLFFDFEDYYQRLSSQKDHAELKSLINNVVIYKAATPAFMPAYSGFSIKSFSGITSYIPQPGFSLLNEEYKKLAWMRGK